MRQWLMGVLVILILSDLPMEGLLARAAVVVPGPSGASFLCEGHGCGCTARTCTPATCCCRAGLSGATGSVAPVSVPDWVKAAACRGDREPDGAPPSQPRWPTPPEPGVALSDNSDLASIVVQVDDLRRVWSSIPLRPPRGLLRFS